MKKNLKLITIIIFVLAAVAALVFIAQKNAGNDQIRPATGKSSGILFADSASYDFGTLSMANGTVSNVFTIKNKGAEPAKITKIYTSCMCTTALLDISGEEIGPFGMPGHQAVPKIDKTLSPGQEAKIKVEFDPAAHGPAAIGRVERVVYIENDVGGTVELNISAMVTP